MSDDVSRLKREKKELQKKYNSERESREMELQERDRLFFYYECNEMQYNFLMCIALKSAAGQPLLSCCDKAIELKKL